MPHVNFTSPVRLLTTNGGEIGIAFTDGGRTIIGWVNEDVCSGDSAVLTVTSHHNQWFHVGISWYSGDVYLFLNGNLLSGCSKNADPMTKAKKLFQDTQTDQAYLIIEAPDRGSIGYRLAVGIINIWEDSIDSELNIGSFMGLSRFQANYFAQASFHWPMSGLLRTLAPDRITTANVELGKDRKNVDGGALCTDNTTQSYIVLTGDYRPKGNYSNLYFSCLYDISRCQNLLFIIDFQLKGQVNMEDREFVLLRTPPQSNALGLEITVNPLLGMLTVTHRTADKKCKVSIDANAAVDVTDSWTNLQALIQLGDLVLRINDEVIQSPAQCITETSQQLPFEIGKFPKIVIGHEVGLCISDVVIIEGTTQMKPSSALLDDLCYTTADVILPLNGTEPNWKDQANKAIDLSSFTAGMTENKLNNCFNKFMTQCSEFTVVFWMNIKCDSVHSSSSSSPVRTL